MRSYYKVYASIDLRQLSPYQSESCPNRYALLVPHKLYNDGAVTGIDRPSFFDSAVPRILQYDHFDAFFPDGSPGETVAANTLLMSYIFTLADYATIKLLDTAD